MRNYILTEWEKEILNRFLADGTKLDGYSVVKNRVFKALPGLLKDCTVLSKVYDKIKEETSPELRGFVKEYRELCVKLLKEGLSQQ